MWRERNHVLGSFPIKFLKNVKGLAMTMAWILSLLRNYYLREGDFGLRIGVFSPVTPNFPVIRHFKILITVVYELLS